MDTQNKSLLKQLAAEKLSASPANPKRQILLHTGILLLVSLVLTVVDFLLDKAISNTGGLSGLGTRGLLSTVQSCLHLMQVIVLPFWQIGYTYVTMQFARGTASHPRDLCAGFSLFLPVLRLQLFKALIVMAIGFCSSQAGTFLFLLTPWSKPLLEVFDVVMTNGDALALEAAMDTVAQEIFVPLMICNIIAFLIAAAPFFYHFRLADYILLDEPEKGALYALRTSWRRMRGNISALFKLDISFWWFFLLDLLVSAVAYADAILLALRVPLPVSQEFAFFATFFVYLVCQLALYWWRKNEVSTTYAVFYEALHPAPQESNPSF